MVDEWVCDASSASIVADDICGNICGNPSSPEYGLDFPDIAVPPKISPKGSADSRPERVELADDEFEEVTDLSNSSTDDAV